MYFLDSHKFLNSFEFWLKFYFMFLSEIYKFTQTSSTSDEGFRRHYEDTVTLINTLLQVHSIVVT